jgi:hypothetical protein
MGEKFSIVMYFPDWSNFGKITFWSLFWKIIVLVHKIRRLNLVLFYALGSLV